MKVHTSETAVLVVFAVTLIGCILAGIPDPGSVGTWISDLFRVHFEPRLYGQRYFRDVLEGNQDGEKYFNYVFTHRDADGALAGGGNDPGDRLLLRRAYESVGHDLNGISFKCSGFCPDWNGIWYSGDHGCDLYDDGKGNGVQRDPCRRSDPFRSLFWRSLFSGFDECSSGGGADAYKYL